MRLSGPIYALLAISIFAIQDSITKHIGQNYSPFLIAMVRYWAFGLFVILWAARSRNGFTNAFHTEHLGLQILRGLLLTAQILISILSITYVGLAQSQAIFVAAPLIVALLSVPILGEQVGWRRWLAILIGLVGVLIIIDPLGESFSNLAILPISCVITMSFYGLFTRLVARYDSPEVSFFYTGVVGLVLTSLIGPFFWTDVPLVDWAWLLTLCLTSVSGHYFLIRALALTEAVTVQSITYLQLVYASLIGFFIFNENITVHMLAGSLIVVAAGGFTIWREHRLNFANRRKKR